MRGLRISLIAVICQLFCFITGALSSMDTMGIVWKEVSGSIKKSYLQRIAVHPDNRDTVYTASSASVYKTIDGGETWTEVLSLRGTENKVNALAVAAKSESVFAGTQEGLFRSDDSGMHWTRIFRKAGDIEGAVSAIAIDAGSPEVIFIGAGSAVYRTENDGKDWIKCLSAPAGAPVTSVIIDNIEPDIVYVSFGNEVFKSINRGIAWQRIFTSINSGENDSSYAEGDEPGKGMEIRVVLIDPSDNRRIYLCASRGLLISEDSGAAWKASGKSGLLSRDIRHLAANPGDTEHIFAATEKGVFRYSRIYDRWDEITDGNVPGDIGFLAFSQDTLHDAAVLWAGGKGIFRTVLQIRPRPTGKDADTRKVLSYFDYEPTIEEIREAAITYAEVSPGKIEAWRKAAAKKAWLPRLSIDLDRDVSDLWHWEGGSTTNKNDDILTRGKDALTWGIKISWDLSELIWSDDQTSIDNRSRLMVQLRDDILNEVTRLYFERRKMQIEAFLSPTEDIRTGIDRELRIQELTADIDALTGSYLSKRLSQQISRRLN